VGRSRQADMGRSRQRREEQAGMGRSRQAWGGAGRHGEEQAGK